MEKTEKNLQFPTAHRLRPPNSCHLWLSHDSLQLLPQLCLSQQWSRRQRFLQSVDLFLSLAIQWEIIPWCYSPRCQLGGTSGSPQAGTHRPLIFLSISPYLVPPFPEGTPCRDTANSPQHLCPFTFIATVPSLCLISSTEQRSGRYYHAFCTLVPRVCPPQAEARGTPWASSGKI